MLRLFSIILINFTSAYDHRTNKGYIPLVLVCMLYIFIHYYIIHGTCMSIPCTLSTADKKVSYSLNSKRHQEILLIKNQMSMISKRCDGTIH